MFKLNIYLIEPDPLIATMLIETLNQLGHQVCGIATSAEAAIEELSEANADLVITDIKLAGHKTGIDLANHINTNLHIPFIFQSKVSDSAIINKALESGPCALMRKPANKQKLSLAITNVVGVLA